MMARLLAEIRTNREETETNQAKPDATLKEMKEKIRITQEEMRAGQEHLKKEMRAGQELPKEEMLTEMETNKEKMDVKIGAKKLNLRYFEEPSSPGPVSTKPGPRPLKKIKK
jgi:hypothetical protein